MEGPSLKEQARDALLRQRDVSECGVVCLVSIVKYYGEEISLDPLWELSDANTKGTTLQGLLEAAEAVGLEGEGYEADLENLSDLDAPCVLHVTKGEGRQHYVVCYGTVDGKFLIGDPECGVDEIHPALLAQRWQSRVLLTAEPRDDFEAQVAATKEMSTKRLSEEEYKCLGVDSILLGQTQMLVETAGLDAPRLLPSGLGQVLLLLDRFDTIENHADTCVRALSQQEQGARTAEDDNGDTSSVSKNQKRDVRHQLHRFGEAGLLTAKSDVREKIRSLQDVTSDAPPSITSICIPTAGRPDSLRRALQSYTVADSGLPPSTYDGMTLTWETIPREWWFYHDREALLSGVRSSDEQFLDVHEQLLGWTPGQCLAELDDQGESLRIGDIDAEFLEHVQDDTTVVLSFAGAMGDSGRLNMQVRILSDDATFGRLTEDYNSHMDTTEVLRAPTRPTITNSAGCVSMNVGIDNRAPMPPFMPVGQGEDHIFGLALRLCFQHGYRGYLPHSLRHDPQGERTRDEGVEFSGFGAYSLTQHVMSAADEWLEEGHSAVSRLGERIGPGGASSHTGRHRRR